MPRTELDTTDAVTGEHPAVDPLVGLTLDGRFRIVDVIGRGAMGKVYRAVQLPLNRAVALKVLDSRFGIGRETSFRQRFLVEAALTAKLSHPNTVRVVDYGSTSDGLFYLAMEHLDGRTLDEVLKAGPLAWRRVLNIGQQVARALREAHDLGVVHRDLKPGNVFMLDVDADADHVKVLDFGLVKSFVEGQDLAGRAITQQGMLMGSPPYMAPEQGEQNRADPRSDIYSLGVVLYEALGGQPPFRGNAPLEIILKHVHQPVPPLVTPPGLEPIPEGFAAVVYRCLAKSPMDRFQSMDEVLTALGEVAPPILTPALETPSVEVPLPRRRHLALAVGFGAAMLVGIGATALVTQRLSRPREVAAPAPAPAPIEAARPAPTEELVVLSPEAPTRVTFHIESTPPGATVTLDGAVLGVTPLDLERPAGPDGRTLLEVTLTKDGFSPVTATAGGSGARVDLLQRLQPLPPDEPPAAFAPRPTPPPRARPVKRHEKSAGDAPPASKLRRDDEPPAPPADELKRPAH